MNGAGEPLVWTAAPVIYNPDRGKLGDLTDAGALAHLATSAHIIGFASPATSGTYVPLVITEGF